MLERIKAFLMNLFKKIKKQKCLNERNSINNIQAKSKTEFENQIKVEVDNEEARILKLQKDYEAGLIDEEDLSENDFDLLYSLYEKQIEKTKQSIQDYKNKILVLKSKLV